MKSICMTAVFLVMVLLTACQGLAEKKNVQSNETTSSTLRLSNTDQQKYQETSGETVQGIERWWLKRNENHQTPEVSDYIDLSKYDAYYVNPKCKKKKIFLTFDCGYENGFTPKILDVLKKQKIVAGFCNETVYQRGERACKEDEEGRTYCWKPHGTSQKYANIIRQR